MKIELTDEQMLAVKQGGSVTVVDPVSERTYVVLADEQYQRVRELLERDRLARNESVEPTLEIPPGIRRSQEVFWRDLPELLKNRRNHGKWVAYYGEEQIGIARTGAELLRAIVRRGIPDDAYYLARIRPRELPPWEIEEIEPLAAHHREDPTEP
jgi:hypothetical protein